VVYLSPAIQPLSVNIKFKVIILFLVMIGAFISPTFAQQFKEPNYKIRGGDVKLLLVFFFAGLVAQSRKTRNMDSVVAS